MRGRTPSALLTRHRLEKTSPSTIKTRLSNGSLPAQRFRYRYHENVLVDQGRLSGRLLGEGTLLQSETLHTLLPATVNKPAL